MEDLEIKSPFWPLYHTSSLQPLCQCREKGRRGACQEAPPEAPGKDRDVRERLRGTTREAVSSQENLFTLFSVVPSQPSPDQLLVKSTNTLTTSSCFPRSEYLGLPMLFPHAALPRDFYGSVRANTRPSRALAISARAVFNDSSSKRL